MTNTPSKNQIRNAYVYRDDDLFPDPYAEGDDFDRWLAEVRAEAWDEGYERAESDRWSTGFWAKGMRSNPYRPVDGLTERTEKDA